MKLISKTIYAKRKSHKFDETAFKKIMQLEITEHILKYPYLQFDKITGPIKNSDKSNTYHIHFK